MSFINTGFDYVTLPLIEDEIKNEPFINTINNAKITEFPGVSVVVGDHPKLGVVTLTTFPDGKRFLSVVNDGHV